jgi:hypothetical protein
VLQHGSGDLPEGHHTLTIVPSSHYDDVGRLCYLTLENPGSKLSLAKVASP